MIPATLALALFATCGRPPEMTGRILEYGLFEFGPGKPGARETRFTSHGDVITARLGSQFGFRFRLDNVPKGASVDLETYVTHPPIAMPNGETRTRYALLTTIPVTNGSAISVTGYSFDRPAEMAPGVWTFTHKFHGRMIVEKSFTVRAPEYPTM